MSKRNKGGRPGKLERRRRVLERLEAQFEKFKSAGEDKPSWTSTRNGGKRTVTHSGRKFEAECKRFNDEISILKHRISGPISSK